jgi:uncharacterized protein YcgL (UPF0745 family)
MGQPEYGMKLEMIPERKLAQESAADVLKGITNHDFLYTNTAYY